LFSPKVALFRTDLHSPVTRPIWSDWAGPDCGDVSLKVPRHRASTV